MVDYPSHKEMLKFYKKTMELSQKQFDTFVKYFSNDNYDFGFLGITTPDRMQHFLWRYTDKDDNTYPDINRLENSILRMYQLMDENIERILDIYGEEHNVVVISDHGHGRRCQKN